MRGLADQDRPVRANLASLHELSACANLSRREVVLESLRGVENSLQSEPVHHAVKSVLLGARKYELSGPGIADALSQFRNIGKKPGEVQLFFKPQAELLADFMEVVTVQVEAGSLVIEADGKVERSRDSDPVVRVGTLYSRSISFTTLRTRATSSSNVPFQSQMMESYFRMGLLKPTASIGQCPVQVRNCR